MGMWGKYVPVTVRQNRAKRKINKLKKMGHHIEPIEINGRQIAKEFWGRRWCDHLDTFADYSNRLPRGKTYVRNGSICHLEIQKGRCEALVNGSRLYRVAVEIKPLKKSIWEELKKSCQGKIGSILELLQGRLSKHVMEMVVDPYGGLFPKENEITFDCSCPDWAGMCKHVVAVCYGIGSRLDQRPELLFQLRHVDPTELISTELAFESSQNKDQLQSDDLGALFGIDLEDSITAPPPDK